MRILLLAFTLTLLASCGDNPTYISHPDYQGQIDDLNGRVGELDKRLLIFQGELNTLDAAVTENGVSIDQLEINVNDLLNRVSDLESDVRIDAIQSPCPDSDEVLVYLDDGRIMAYFETGNKRYLSILSSGTYRTTDNASCTFTVP
jgi:uncharacterized coiled-coil protein SlyX